MVTEAKETMTRFVDTMNESVRTTFDTTRRAQEGFFKTVTETAKSGPAFPGFETFFTTGERFVKEFGPLVSKNIETFAQSFDAGFRANADAFRTICEVASQPQDGDFYKKTRKVWDATFDAFRTNFDAFGKSGARAAENCSTFCQTVCSEDAAPKSNSKPARANA